MEAGPWHSHANAFTPVVNDSCCCKGHPISHCYHPGWQRGESLTLVELLGIFPTMSIAPNRGSGFAHTLGCVSKTCRPNTATSTDLHYLRWDSARLRAGPRLSLCPSLSEAQAGW